jgi:hypothetical protein
MLNVNKQNKLEAWRLLKYVDLERSQDSERLTINVGKLAEKNWE